MSVQTMFVSLPVNDGTEMQCFVAYPSNTSTTYPGLILFQEAFGVNHHIRVLAERFAAEGYVVIAPELFHRTAPKGFETGYDFQLVAPHFNAVTNEGIVSDAQAVYDWLGQFPQVQKGNIASTGYCMGGRVSFIANSVLPLRAAISYYGGGIAKQLSLVDSLHAPMLFCWGGQDTHIPQEQVTEITDAMTKAGKQYANLVFSYAGHAFFCEERPSYHPQAANEAWALTLAFLKEELA